MSSPPTMLIQEQDDQKTLVDPRIARFNPDGDITEVFVDPKTRREQELHTRSSKRKFTEAGVVLALILGLGAVAYQQHRVADKMRATIDEIQSRRSESSVRAPVGSVSQEWTSARIETGSAVSSMEFEADQREALENRGASLVASNDFLGALAHYKMLAELLPDEEVFQDIVFALRTKLSCADPFDPAGNACP